MDSQLVRKCLQEKRIATLKWPTRAGFLAADLSLAN